MKIIAQFELLGGILKKVTDADTGIETEQFCPNELQPEFKKVITFSKNKDAEDQFEEILVEPLKQLSGRTHRM